MSEKSVPMRRCVGCMESKPKKALIRIAGYEGQVTIDSTGKAKGRGAYLCKNEECFAKAVKKKAISRNIKMEINSEQMEKLSLEFPEYAKREKEVF